DPKKARLKALDPANVTYQGRVLVAVLTLVPAMIWKLTQKKTTFISEKSTEILTEWLRDVANRADLLDDGVFIGKDKFKKRGYLGSGGIGRFRDMLWAATLGKTKLGRLKPETIEARAKKNHETIAGGA